MGTLIEDAAEVATLATAIDTAIVAKGGTLVGGGKLRNAAAGIATISGGSEWTPPSEWPNLRTLLANDTETAYTNKLYFLYNKCSYPTITLNYPKWITSDGATYNGNATHTWTGGGTYGWAAVYSNSKITFFYEYEYLPNINLLWICANKTIRCGIKGSRSLACIESEETVEIQGQYTSGYNALRNNMSLARVINCVPAIIGTSSSFMFSSCNSLTAVPDELDLSACTTCQAVFSGCYSLTAVPDELDLSACTNCSGMFTNCNSLTAVPDELDLSACTNCSSMFYGCYSLTAVPDEFDLSACTNCSYMFYNCNSLTAVPDELDLSACTNCSSMFYGCYSLTAVPDELDLSACTNCSSMFYGCYSLTAVPDELDLSACTNCSSMFYGCYSLTAVPEHLTVNISFSFAQSLYVSKASVATFDADGVVNGGMIYNLNTCPNSGQTVTLNSTIKAKFTSDEQTAIVTALTAKNWSIAW